MTSVLKRRNSNTDLGPSFSQAAEKPVRSSAASSSSSVGRAVVQSILTLLLAATVIGFSAYGVYLAFAGQQYDAVQDRNLQDFKTKEALDVAALNAADDANVALLEGEILTVVNRLIATNTSLSLRLDGCCQFSSSGNGSSYNDTFILANLTSIWTAFYAARAAFQHNFTNFFLVLNATLSMTDHMDVKHINGQAPLDNHFVFTGQNGVTVTPGAASNELYINGSAPDIVADVGIQINITGFAVTVKNTGIVTVNSQSPDPSSGNLQVIGQGMITVHPGNSSVEVAVDGTTLATAINNLDMTVSVHSMSIANLSAADAILQQEINALNISSTIVSLIMNDTVFNLEIMNLMINITTLQQQVTALQNQLANLTAISVTTGSIIPWSGMSSSVPSGYLYCDGGSYATSTYGALSAVVGCQYCPGMTGCGSTFCVPDLRGRIPVGLGGASFLLRGTQVGEEMHTLITAEMPSHTHTEASSGTHTHTGTTDAAGVHNHALTMNAVPNHQHHLKLQDGCGTANQGFSTARYEFSTTFTSGLGGGGGFVGIAFGDVNNNNIGGSNVVSTASSADDCTFQASQPTQTGATTRFNNGAEPGGGHTPSGTIGNDGSHTHTFTTGSGGAHVHVIDPAGSGTAHNNIQPSLVIGGYMIKT